jgi:Family of unknown function (DUF5677)
VFESEGERLAWLFGEVERFASNSRVSLCDPADIEVFHVTASWLARCTEMAKAISVLAHNELHASTGVVLRSLWELWIDWRYLLKVGDRRLNAAKVLLNAQIAALDFVDAHASQFEEGYLQKLHQNVAEFEAGHPEVSAQVRKQRSKKQFHWSGLTFSQMERLLAPEATVYGQLSWEPHSTVTTIRDVSLDVEDSDAFFRFGQTEEAIRPEFMLFSAGGVLFFVYNDFARLWGLQSIAAPA